jgi:dihydroorotase-like cyclic amidohydrolase
VIGSDHAPHTLEEKAKPYPQCPSGTPGVQTVLRVMLTHVAEVCNDNFRVRAARIIGGVH